MILLWLGIAPSTKTDQENLARALSRLMADHPAFTLRPGTDGEVLIGAGSEDQLDAVASQLAHEFDVEAAITGLHVACKETLTRAAEGESKYATQSGGRGAYAHVKLRVEPGYAGSGFVCDQEIFFAGAIPEGMIPSVEEGIAEARDRGVLAGYPIDDVRVTLYDGSYHDIDSSAAAFKIAGRLAFIDAARRAKPILLEPIMNVSVVAPPDCESRVLDGLRQRQAGFQSHIEQLVGTGMMTIATQVPLSQLFGFSLELRQRTQGQGTVTMTFSHYAPTILSEDDGDRDVHVRSPLSPRTPPRDLRAAVPEPHD
jgi:elongation factor G